MDGRTLRCRAPWHGWSKRAEDVMSDERRFPGWVRHAGIGLELAGATAGLALLGYWIDGRFGTKPWGIVAGVVIGLVGGLYNMVRESLTAVHEAQVEDKAASDLLPGLPVKIEGTAGANAFEADDIEFKESDYRTAVQIRAGGAETREALAQAGEYDLKGVPDRWRLFRVRLTGIQCKDHPLTPGTSQSR